jgi:ABC-type glycerol-3-phosphate transport system substrate-binding protein
MKKFATLLLIVFFLLSACSSAPGDEQAEGENVGNDEKPAEFLDLNGAEITFFTSWPQHYRPEEAFSAEGDAMRARFTEVETNNNCIISVTQPTGGVLATIQANLSVGDPAHLCDLAATDTYTLYKADALVPFEEISTIDLSDEKKWGPPHIRQHGFYNGLTYGVHRFNSRDSGATASPSCGRG